MNYRAAEMALTLEELDHARALLEARLDPARVVAVRELVLQIECRCSGASTTRRLSTAECAESTSSRPTRRRSR